MTDLSLSEKQPTTLDYADPTKFKFQIIKLPTVEYNTTAANVPGITLTEMTQPTRLQQLKIAGNDISFDDLTVTFIVDDELINYRKVHDWMVGLGQVDSDNKFRDILTEGKDRFPLSQLHATKGSTPDGAVYSDAKLIHLSNRNIPKVEVSFVDCYPKSLSALDYNQGATDTEYLQATVTFGYKYHSFTTPF